MVDGNAVDVKIVSQFCRAGSECEVQQNDCEKATGVISTLFRSNRCKKIFFLVVCYARYCKVRMAECTENTQSAILITVSNACLV